MDSKDTLETWEEIELLQELKRIIENPPSIDDIEYEEDVPEFSYRFNYITVNHKKYHLLETLGGSDCIVNVNWKDDAVYDRKLVHQTYNTLFSFVHRNRLIECLESEYEDIFSKTSGSFLFPEEEKQREEFDEWELEPEHCFRRYRDRLHHMRVTARRFLYRLISHIYWAEFYFVKNYRPKNWDGKEDYGFYKKTIDQMEEDVEFFVNDSANKNPKAVYLFGSAMIRQIFIFNKDFRRDLLEKYKKMNYWKVIH